MEIIISKFLVEQCAVNLQPSKHESWWRRLEDALKMPLPLSSEESSRRLDQDGKLNSLAVKLNKIFYFLKKLFLIFGKWSPVKKLFIFSGGNFLSWKNKKNPLWKISSLKKKLLNFLAPKILIIIFMLLIKFCYTPDKNPLGETGSFSLLYLLVLKHPIF